MKRTRQRVIKNAVWEIRYHTRLSWFDKAGAILQPFLEWNERQSFPQWSHSVGGENSIELKNPTTGTQFALGVRRARATTENLLPLGDYGQFRDKALDFFNKAMKELGVQSVARAGHRLQYLVSTKDESGVFVSRVVSQLTKLDEYNAVDACNASDVSVIWTSTIDQSKCRWTVGPLSLREFPNWFQTRVAPPDASKDQRAFYPGMSLLIDVDAWRDEDHGELQSTSVAEFFRSIGTSVDRQVEQFADMIREE